jgi:hypothetical protein
MALPDPTQAGGGVGGPKDWRGEVENTGEVLIVGWPVKRLGKPGSRDPTE